MKVTSTTSAPVETAADTIAVGVFEDEGSRTTSTAARSARCSTPARPGGGSAMSCRPRRRTALAAVGLGRRDEFTPERARIAAAVALARAKEISCSTLCWELPHHVGADVASGFVEGTLLGAYRFTRYKGGGPDDDGAGPGELVVSDHHDVSDVVRRGGRGGRGPERRPRPAERPGQRHDADRAGRARAGAGGGDRGADGDRRGPRADRRARDGRVRGGGAGLATRSRA